MITQSGGVGMSVLNLMSNEGLGLNKFVSVGNMLDVDAEDMLEHLIADDGTGLIFMYLESIRDGRRLMEIARQSTKPILIFKANIGKLGQNIARSHTASLTSDDKVVEAAFHQAGIIRIHDATALGNSLKILGLPPVKGENLAVISRSGGHAVIAADACELSGFNLARLPESFLREIERYFRASVIRLTNPLDLGDLFDLNLYAQIIEQTLQLEGVDGVVFLHTSLSEENRTSRELLERLMRLVEKYGKPVAYYLSAEAQEVAYLKQNYNFPIFTQVVETVRALEMSRYYGRQAQQIQSPEESLTFPVNRDGVRSIIEQAQGEQRSLLLSEALQVLEYYGIPTVQGRIAQTVEEAKSAAQAIGYPVAIKIVAEQISHKSDVGGVQLNLRNGEALAAAFDDMLDRIHQAYPQARIDGVLVQPMVTGGRELILGGRQDPQFGPVLLLGLGGSSWKSRGSGCAGRPISHQVAQEMVENLRLCDPARVVTGLPISPLSWRSCPACRLLTDFPRSTSLDINPLRLFHETEGCCALDAA
jgi:acetyltransferase